MKFNWVLLALLLGVVALASACGSSDDRASTSPESPAESTMETPSPSESGRDGAQDGTTDGKTPTDMTDKRARVVDTAFEPDDFSISAPTTVVWKQIGLQAHSVSASDESFESSPACTPIKVDECLDQGDVFRHDFEAPGTYDYYCRVHGSADGGGMAGTITVTE